MLLSYHEHTIKIVLTIITRIICSSFIKKNFKKKSSKKNYMFIVFVIITNHHTTLRFEHVRVSNIIITCHISSYCSFILREYSLIIQPIPSKRGMFISGRKLKEV